MSRLSAPAGRREPQGRGRAAWSAPRLRVGAAAERRAPGLELFFDLVFVVAIAALAGVLCAKTSPGVFLGFFLLPVPVGSAWTSFAYYSDQFDTDDALFGVVMLVAMLLSAALAANAWRALWATALSASSPPTSSCGCCSSAGRTVLAALLPPGFRALLLRRPFLASVFGGAHVQGRVEDRGERDGEPEVE